MDHPTAFFAMSAILGSLTAVLPRLGAPLRIRYITSGRDSGTWMLRREWVMARGKRFNTESTESTEEGDGSATAEARSTQRRPAAREPAGRRRYELKQHQRLAV
jgi:hypothetical protein